MTERQVCPPEGATLDEIIARLAWQVEQPNSYPLVSFYPLIEAIARRLKLEKGAQARSMENLLLPTGGSWVDVSDAGGTHHG